MTTVRPQRLVPREGGGDQGGEGPPVRSEGKGPSAGRALLGAPPVAEECSDSRGLSFLCEVGGKDAKNGAKRGVKRSGFKGVKKVRERWDGAAAEKHGATGRPEPGPARSQCCAAEELPFRVDLLPVSHL